MALLSIIKYGDPILRKSVNEVVAFTNLKEIIDDMFDTMYYERGIGLAANQVGINLSILIFDIVQYENNEEMDVAEDKELLSNPQVFINPKILESTGQCVMEECCLSVPEIRAEITRASEITLQYQDVNGDTYVSVFSDLSARVILHEIDHLHGKFFTDYLPQAKRILIQKRLQKIALTGLPSTGVIL